MRVVLVLAVLIPACGLQGDLPPIAGPLGKKIDHNVARPGTGGMDNSSPCGGQTSGAGGGTSPGGGAGGTIETDRLWLPTNPRIMALGDSITFGTGYDAGGGYRGYLWADLPTIQPVGTVTPERLPGLLDKDACEGHPGADATQLAAGISGWLAQTGHVDAVLLHVCTNSLGAGADCTAGIMSIYRALIAANPDTIVLIANPIVSPDLGPDDVNTPLYQASLAGIAASLSSMPRAITVAMPRLLQSEYWDYWHPNSGGYRRMADAWETALIAIGAR